MFSRFFLWCSFVFLIGCKQSIKNEPKLIKKEELVFLDEFILETKTPLNGLQIGGISGIDYSDGFYYSAIDDQDNPRVLQLKINITKDTISSIDIEKFIVLPTQEHDFYKTNSLDLESIVVKDSIIYLTSEGAIKEGKNPIFFQMNLQGKYTSNFQIPNKFLAGAKEKPLHNATLEGLTKSYDGLGFWTAFELPLQSDGVPPAYPETKSPIRITYFDVSLQKAIKEFAYELSALPRKPKGGLNINGVTDILAYKKDHFLIIERAYQSSYINDTNSIRIYKAVADKNTTNTIDYLSLKDSVYTPLRKELIFDFNTEKSKLKYGVIDNIEGVTFGPRLSNGNPSIIFVSDDNFQQYGKQFNQFILMELKN